MADNFDNMLNYCAGLTANNNRAWFHEHHVEYDVARADFAALLEQLRFDISAAAPALEADIMYTRVKDWTYRIPRDARIHRDLPPYNPSFRAYISADRKSWLPIGYFLHIGVEGAFYGTGVWCRENAKTNQIRDYITNHADELERILAESGIVLQGDTVKTMPRGYAADCPGAQWVKYKNWMFFEYLPKKAMKSYAAFGRAIGDMTRRFEPMRQFLLTAATEETVKENLSRFYTQRQPDMW